MTTAVATAVSGMTVTVQMRDGTVTTLQRLRHAAVAVGDLVVIHRHMGQAWISGSLGTGGAPAQEVATEPDASGGASSGPTVPPPAVIPAAVSPTSTGTYRPGSARWLTDRADLAQGNAGYGDNWGAAYYGARLSRLGTLLSVRVRLVRGTGGVYAAQAPTMHLLAGGSRPAGSPASLASTPGPAIRVGGATPWAVPASWLAPLSSGAAGGIGIHIGSRSPYIRLAVTSGGMTIAATYREG